MRKREKNVLFLREEVQDPQRYGVPEFELDRIVKIEEKPAKPMSSYAVTGIYIYDSDVFSIIRTLRPSDRGEPEITDVNNVYLQRGELTYDILDGWWTDAGTHKSLARAHELAQEIVYGPPFDNANL
ncbi:MAG: hypothetical protein K6T83_07130 [Alicyclobacillus sp.]|nr:hypothetical protein [Alicyclobacillus sp.]